MSPGFSFGFFDNDTTTTDDTTAAVAAAAPITTATGSSSSSSSSDVVGKEEKGEQQQQQRRPFVWVPNLNDRLVERSTQEMIYCEVFASSSTSAVAVDETAETVGMDPIDTDAADDTDAPCTTTSSLVKYVDIEHSSFVAVEQSSSSSTTTTMTQQQRRSNKSDLEAGVYEGGSKVWEASVDLVRYLNQNNSSSNIQLNLQLHQLRVLELGCGHALPGCFLLKQLLQLEQQQQQAAAMATDDCNSNDNDSNNRPPLFSLTLVDYNDFVLEDVTVSNLVLNSLDLDLEDNNNNNNSNLATIGEDNEQQEQQQTVAAQASASPQENDKMEEDEEKQDETTIINTATLNDQQRLQRLSHVASRVQLGSGDWLDFSQQLLLQRQQLQQEEPETEATPKNNDDSYFDFIVAAETLYSLEATEATALFLLRHLRRPTAAAVDDVSSSSSDDGSNIGGVAYLATKRYYFGVGGGTHAFLEACDRLNQQQHHTDDDYLLKVQTVSVVDHGCGNIRDILKVTLTTTINSNNEATTHC